MMENSMFDFVVDVEKKDEADLRIPDELNYEFPCEVPCDEEGVKPRDRKSQSFVGCAHTALRRRQAYALRTASYSRLNRNNHAKIKILAIA